MAALSFDAAKMKEMMEHALEFGGGKLGHHDKEQTKSALRCGDCIACGYVRYGLAQEVAGYIGSLDTAVKAVYTYEPDHATDADCMATFGPPLSPAINMIAWVEHRSAALASVVDMLRSAVSEELMPLVCPKANALCSMLDFQVVDDDEVARRRGYGALITSMYVRPLEIWRR